MAPQPIRMATIHRRRVAVTLLVACLAYEAARRGTTHANWKEIERSATSYAKSLPDLRVSIKRRYCAVTANIFETRCNTNLVGPAAQGDAGVKLHRLSH